MSTLRKILVGWLALMSLVLSPASEAAWIGGAMNMGQADHVDFVMPVLGPFAYVHFCLRYPDECRVRGRAFRRPRAVKLTPERRADLMAINAEVNRAILPKHYVNDTTFDTWRIDPARGDCNDYAISKRHALLARGWPTRALLLSEVITPWGEHHLILLVRTDHGNFVLDNLNPQVRSWSRTNYRWVRVQLPSEPSLWSTIRDPRLIASS